MFNIFKKRATKKTFQEDLAATQVDFMEDSKHTLRYGMTPKEEAKSLYQAGEHDLAVIAKRVKRAERTVRGYIQELRWEGYGNV